ncbi:MAG TPA: SH3 domain-containing protein [Candidatus Sulfotelmatobacter sp.]|jgi:uncharacterized protein YgiM (DUF1202 family)|nr:SH3 domain-containing protein [Candidatus Sulfotelmatobacter sp.]
MKLNCCLLLAVAVAVSATAQTSTNSLPAIPPPVVGSPAPEAVPAPNVVVPETPTNPPVKKAAAKKKKKAAAKKAAPKAAKLPEPTATLAAGSAEVVVNNVNVRGQAGLKGEVITHVQKGDTVEVLSQISLDKHKADEPSQWAKITLPTNVTVWVDSKYISADKTVSVKKLNLRAGPGENYSVLGVVEKGTFITEAGAKGAWTKIESPTNAYAFIAAMYLKQEASGNVPTNPAPSTETPPPTPTTVADNSGMVAPPPSGAPGAPTGSPDTGMVAPAPQIPSVIIQTNIIVVTDTNVPPPPPRVVTHEGTVRRSVSIVAPTYFELYDPSTDTAINYLYSTTTNLNLVRYNGFQISVTGEEGLDPRWARTPVLTVQKIYVLSTPSSAADKSQPVKPAHPFK